MRKVVLKMNEYNKYLIIKNLVDNNGNKNTTAIKHNLSRRQIDHLIIYKEKGNPALFTVTVDIFLPKC